MNIGEVFVNLADVGEPPLIAQLARASWLAGVAQAAVRLELFTKSRGKKLNSAEVASLLGANPQYTREMLNSCLSVCLL